MEGFTLVLLFAWLLLVATYVGMYFMDQATKAAGEKNQPLREKTAKKGK